MMTEIADLQEHYRCDNCDMVFKKTRSDEEAYQEFLNSPLYIPGEDEAIVCADCYAMIKKYHGVK